MPVFSYRASTVDGQIIEGVIEAATEKSAIEKLKDTGVIPLRVTVPKAEKKFSGFFKPSPKKGLLTFTTELSVMLNAGLPLDRSLSILSDISESKGMKEIIQEVVRDIHGGNSFSDAIARHPAVFSKLYVNMVRAGEAGGVLESIMEKLTEFLESSSELRDHVSSAMVYPIILSVTGTGSIIVLLTYVLPKFSVIFEDLGKALPAPTRILLAISHALGSYWWLFILIGAGLWILFKNYVKTREGRYKWDNIKLRHSFDLIRKLEISRFCRTLGTLLKSGVPILQALNNVKDIVDNSVIAAAVDRVSKGTKEGEGISRPIIETKMFPALAVSMIKIGEETGQLDIMLIKVAETYERILKMAIKKFIGLIEPVMILVMGLIIGLIVLAILMAVFSVNDLPF